MTPPDIAAKLLYYIYHNEPIEQYTVADIGIGTGMLICGAIYLEAKYISSYSVLSLGLNWTKIIYKALKVF